MLIKMLQHAYVTKKGVRPIFREMVLLDYIPSKKDFPKEIDDTTYRCFLKVYHSVKQEEVQAREAQKRQKTKARQVSAPR